MLVKLPRPDYVASLTYEKPIVAQMHRDSRAVIFLAGWTSAVSNTHRDAPPVTWLTFPLTADAAGGKKKGKHQALPLSAQSFIT